MIQLFYTTRFVKFNTPVLSAVHSGGEPDFGEYVSRIVEAVEKRLCESDR